MSISANALRGLHRSHRQLSDLRERIARGPRQVQAAEAAVQGLTKQLESAKEGLKRARVASDAKQLQLKEREMRVENLKSKLNSCASNREYQALFEQIAADRQANNVLSDEILEAMEHIDQLQKTLGATEANLAKAQEELEKSRRRVEDEQQGLETDLARVAAELQQAESALPPDFRTNYKRIAKVRGEEALAQVEGRCCGACCQTVSTQTMNELLMGKLVFCKSCGALLYLPEGAAPM